MPYHEIVYEDKGKLKKWNPGSKKSKNIASICSRNTHTSSNSPGKCHQHSNQSEMDGGFLFHLRELKEFLLMEKSMKIKSLSDLLLDKLMMYFNSKFS